MAIKNLNKKQASDDYLTKFLPREIAILQRVSHPNIITILQIIETELRCFFMLEIAENGDLLDYINTRRYLPEPEARFIFTQMSQAIGFCHDRDVVHRDLKCENVMLNRNMDVKIGGKTIVCYYALSYPHMIYAHTPKHAVVFRFWFCIGSQEQVCFHTLWVLQLCST